MRTLGVVPGGWRVGDVEPLIQPHVVVAVVEGLTPRVRRRVDALLADRSGWGPVGVSTAFGEATVRLEAVDVVTAGEQVACDCLLAPRCAHRAVVALSLTVADEDDAAGAVAAEHAAPAAAGADDAAPTTADAAPTTADAAPTAAADAAQQLPPGHLTEEQRAAVAEAAAHVADLLQVGTQRLPGTARAALLADLHRLRAHGLVLSDRALTRLVLALGGQGEGQGDGAPGRPDRVAAASAAMLNLWQLQRADDQGEVTPELLGRARQGYHPVGGLVLTPVVAEPVLAGSGFSGVDVTFVDGGGRAWHLSRVAPGGRAEIGGRYRAGAEWGGSPASPAMLSRHRTVVSDATASGSGRLGGGRQVRVAVGQPPAARWAAVPPGHRVVEGEITGGDRTTLGLDGCPLRLTETARRLGAGRATELFGAVPGVRVRCLVRSADDGDQLLGLESLDTRIVMPDELLGVWWPGLDEVTREWVGALPGAAEGARSPARTAYPADESDLDPADWSTAPPTVRDVCGRWLGRVLDGGPAVLHTPALGKDVTWLRRAGAPFAADLLAALAQASRQGERRLDGTWRADPVPLARAWLALSQY